MERTRLTGATLMAVTVLQLLLFIGGTARRSYTALALPIGTIVGVASVLGFWIGWTLFTVEDELTGLEFEAEPLDDA